MKIFANGGWREQTRGKVFISGAWRNVTRAMVYIGGAWKTAVLFASPVTVTAPDASETPVYGNPYGYGQALLRATPSGGLAPYNYAWVINSYSTPLVPTISDPTLASIFVNGSASSGASFHEVNVQVTCTDALGQTAVATASASFVNYFGIG